jgi:hypothetical protein
MEVERNRQVSPHIKAYELFTKAAHGFKERPITERQLKKYQHSLEFAERLRFLMNCVRKLRMKEKYREQGIHVTSAYRHLEYNRKVKSSDTSMHTDPKYSYEPFCFAPCALDLKPYPIMGEAEYSIFTYDEFYQMAELVDNSFPDRAYRLGYYGKSLFVHVDSGYGHGGLRWTGN